MKSDLLTPYTAISLLVTTMLGTGITFMPYAFNSIGYNFSFLILIFVSFCTFISLLCISHVVKISPLKKHTYLSISKDISKFMYYFVNISLFCNCFFSNVSFYRFLTDILIEIFPFSKWLKLDQEYTRKIIALLISPLLLYLSLKKDLVNLKVQSWISTFSVSFLALLIIFYSLFFGSSIYKSDILPFNYNFKYAVPFFLPSMICENSMVEIVQKLRDKSWKNLIFISLTTSLCGSFLYGMVGYCGYIVFGNKIQGHFVKELYESNSKINVFMRTQSFDKYNVLSKLAVYSMAIVLVSGFPIQMISVSNVFMQFMRKENKNDKKRSYVTFCLFLLCFLLVLIENLKIKLIKRVSGAIFSSSVGLIHPFIYYFCLSETKGIYSVVPRCIFGIVSCLIVYILITIILDIKAGDPELYN
ncbi:putative amino acid transporter [Vairimorpha necatrix]|uniref:Amino acid transporter n=1 Tax=Vairimorpha necatrix TaxID=6039 RepID=A0AAX4J893_9MICR